MLVVASTKTKNQAIGKRKAVKNILDSREEIAFVDKTVKPPKSAQLQSVS
jgi:hypothetical protein